MNYWDYMRNGEKPRHTLSVDTDKPRHGDLNGDAVGDAVACKCEPYQRLTLPACDLGSGDESRGSSSLPTRTTA